MLHEFTKIKEELVQLIPAFHSTFEDIINDLKIELIDSKILDDIKDDLTSSNFTVAVVGVIKRGKSTLLNALLGDPMSILSTNVTPETAKLSFLVYDENPFAIIHHLDGQKSKVQLKDLEKYTNSYPKGIYDFRRKNKGVKELVQNTKFAEIHYPNKYLKNGVIIVDTPGVDDPDPERSKVTEEFISKADAVVFMIDVVEGGLKQSELSFLKNRIINKKSSKGIICACNKILALRKHQHSQLESLITQTKKIFKEELNLDIPVFPIDSKAAFEGKVNEDDDLFVKSNFNQFTDALEKYLIEEKGKISLNKSLTTLSEIIIKPAIDFLETKISETPQDLILLQNDIINENSKLTLQKENLTKVKYELELAKKNIYTSSEALIRNEFNSITLNKNSSTNEIRNFIANKIDSINQQILKNIKIKLNNILYQLNAYDIRIPNLQSIIEYSEISMDELYVKKEVKSAGMQGASFIGAGAAAFVASLFFPPLGVIVGGYLGYKAGQIVENEQTSTTIEEFDLIKAQQKLNKIIQELILSFNKTTDLYFNEFQNNLGAWSSQRSTEIQNKYTLLEKMKSIKTSEVDAMKNKFALYLTELKKFESITKNIATRVSKWN